MTKETQREKLERMYDVASKLCLAKISSYNPSTGNVTTYDDFPELVPDGDKYSFWISYKNLPSEKQNKLENLLKQFITVARTIKGGKIKFKITSGGENEDPLDDPIFNFEDNLKGRIALFLPTYKDIPEYMRRNYEKHNRAEKENRVIEYWSEEEECHLVSYTPERIYLYWPKILLEEKGYSIESYPPSVESDLKEFKKDLKKSFLQSDKSPIRCQINTLYEEGEALFEEDKVKRQELEKKKVFEQKLEELNGKEL